MLRAGIAVFLLIGLPTLVPTPVAVSAQDATAIALMEEAGARYQMLDAFCADFTQSLEVPLIGETHDSRGSLCQGKPDLFAMRWTEPAGDRVVADGEFFWVYYPSVDPAQVLQFSMTVRPGGVDFQREFLEAPGEKYTLAYVREETLGDRRAHVISAKPRERTAFTEALLWLDVERSLILRARIGMENGSVRTVTLTNVRLDPPADSQRFRFAIPAGAQVIRRD
jgi:outer membrane lipoprotein carrier protein